MMQLEHKISEPVSNSALRVLSLGAGVQSTVLLLLGLRGAFGPRPDHVIFADTGWEPADVYRNMKWLQGEVARQTNGQTGFHVVSAGNIKADHLAGLNSTGQRLASMPLYTAGGKGMGRRQCTREYKIEPIERKVRDLLGVAKGQRVPRGVVVEQWIGMSSDELPRLKYNPHKWAVNRWPLVEARMTRADCRAWFEREYPERTLAASLCIACPYRDNAGWRAMRDNRPAEFEDACQFDDAIRHNGSRIKGMREQQFVHASGAPLREADLEDNAMGDLLQDECDGMCGV